MRAFWRRELPPPTPGLIVLADSLWRESAPGALHVLTADLAERHPAIWVESPVTQCLKAPGLHPRLRRSLRLDLPAVRYVDGRRELDVATPPLIPAGNPLGDAMLAQTVDWLLRARRSSARVLLLARRGPAASALIQRLQPAVSVDWHDDPAPGDRWNPHADLILWPAWAPTPDGEDAHDPRVLRLNEVGVRGIRRLVPMIEGWLKPTVWVGTETAMVEDILP